MNTQPRPSLSLIVAAAPGIQRDALVSLLRAQPNLTVVAATADLAAVRCSVVAGQLHLIVLDGGLELHAPDDLITWLRNLRRASPSVRCVVLAGNTAQRQAFLQAGAHAALLKGCLDEHLLAALNGL